MKTARLIAWPLREVQRHEGAVPDADAVHQMRAAVRRGRVEKILRKALRRLEERLEAARERPAPKSLHRARRSVKQVRYLLKTGKGSLPGKATRLTADLKVLQASLGELHDVDVRIQLVRKRPLLLRGQREERGRLAKTVAAQLARWDERQVVSGALEWIS